MSVKTKYIVAGVIGLLSITAAITYLQYKRMFDYTIKYAGIKVKKILPDYVSFDLFLLFLNKSAITLHVTKQNYSVFVNSAHVAEITNNNPVTIKPGQNTLPLSIEFDPKKQKQNIEKNVLSFLQNLENNTITVDVKLWIKFLSFNVPIKYKYNTTIKELLSSK